VASKISITLRFPEIEVKMIYLEVYNTPHLNIELTKEADDGSLIHKTTVFSKDLEKIEDIINAERKPSKVNFDKFEKQKFKYNTCTITLSNPF